MSAAYHYACNGSHSNSNMQKSKGYLQGVGDDQSYVLAKCPNRANIFLSVTQKPVTIEEAFQPLLLEVTVKRVQTERTIYFCRNYDDVSHLYLWFMSVLGKAAYEPIGAQNKAQSRMVDMYTACTEPCIQDIVLDHFFASVAVK